MLFRAFVAAVTVSFVAVSFVASSVSAAMLSLSPTADAHIHFGTPTTNYGSSTIVELKNDGTFINHRKAYLRYDLSSIPMYEVITSASLDLTFIAGAGAGLAGTNTFEVFGLNDGVPGETWGEAAINWNNAPANAAGGAAITATASSLGTFTLLGQTGNVNFFGAGGDAVKTFLENSVSNDLVTFIIVRLNDSVNNTQTYVHTLRSKEALLGSSAFLNITTELLPPAPEPSTAVLLGLAAGIVLPGLRRRRAALRQA